MNRSNERDRYEYPQLQRYSVFVLYIIVINCEIRLYISYNALNLLKIISDGFNTSNIPVYKVCCFHTQTILMVCLHGFPALYPGYQQYVLAGALKDR